MVGLLKDDCSKREDPVINNNNVKNMTSNSVIENHLQSTDYYLEKINDEELAKQGMLEHVKATQDFKWRNIVVLSILHLHSVYAALTFPYFTHPHFYTPFFAFFWAQFGIFGTTAGAHRLWTHRSYKAKLPLQIILMLCYMTAGINPIYEWVRDHRIHHKYTETDADPHNSKRGFFFAHVGWLMMKKHPEVIRKGREVDMSDIKNNPVIAFEEKYFVPLWLFFNFILPPCIPVYCWNETWYYSISMLVFIRWSFFMNGLWSVNSAAHVWGNRPYDTKIAPTENFWVSFFAMGEGWHNYHHTFPWDYKAAELPYYYNVAAILIRFFHAIGWAYNLREPSDNLVKMVTLRKGDGSHKLIKEVESSVDDVKTRSP